MGNVVSAILMHALQAAWWCQRMLDQDFRQNHGSRLCPIENCKVDEVDVLLPNCSEMAILSRSPHHYSKPARRKDEVEGRSRRRADSLRAPRLVDCRRRRLRAREVEAVPQEAVPQEAEGREEGREEAEETEEIHPRLTLQVSDAQQSTSEYVEQVRQRFGLRRAFSDVNLRARFEAQPLLGESDTRTRCDFNHNYDSSFVAPDSAMDFESDQAVLRLYVARSFVDRGKNLSAYSVL